MYEENKEHGGSAALQEGLCARRRRQTCCDLVGRETFGIARVGRLIPQNDCREAHRRSHAKRDTGGGKKGQIVCSNKLAESSTHASQAEPPSRKPRTAVDGLEAKARCQ